MARTYTKREIANKLACSVRTVETDADYLNLAPRVEPGKQNLYSEKDYQLISQMRSHCGEGKNRDTFVPQTIPEVIEDIEDEPIITKHNSSSAIKQYSTAQKIKLFHESDPFFSLQIMDRLQEIADKNWFIPTSFMAALLQINPQTLLSYQQYSYGSFVILIATPPVRKKRNYQPATNTEDAPVGLIEPKVILWRVDANNN